MGDTADYHATLPPDQQRIRDKCYHPTGTFIPFPKEAIEQSIPERFEEMVRLYPERLAVKDNREALTYAELNQVANRVAHTILAQCEVKPEPVALLFDHSTGSIGAMLGVLKTGKFYVPLDPSYPQDRLTYILKDTQAGAIITDNAYVSLARQLAPNICQLISMAELDFCSADNPGVSITPDTLAYIIYTSGSTGKPKGIVENHRNVLHCIQTYTNLYHLCADDCLTLLHSISSSGSITAIFGALLNGASVPMLNMKQHTEMHLLQWLQQEESTIFITGVTLLRQVMRHLPAGTPLPSLRLILVGGEPLYRRDVQHYKRSFAPPCILVNCLSATEIKTLPKYFIDHDTAIHGHRVPAGYELDDVNVVILDEDSRPIKDGRLGEIVVCSSYLVPGYWRQPVLTQATFATMQADKETRLYRSGDLGYQRPDGCLIHVGRKDFQIKVRGFRMETSEIESVLLTQKTIQEAVVIAQGNQSDDQRLVAYIVPAMQPAPTVTHLCSTLAQTLPGYMIPSAFVFLDALPLLPSGKVNRRALPKPQRVRPELDMPFVAPRTPIESELAQLWAEVLDLDEVGTHDPFLELGGHSLRATQLLARVVKTFQVELPLQMLLKAPTVAEMAMVIVQHQAAQAGPETMARMLAEVETLSEAQAQNLLAEDQP